MCLRRQRSQPGDISEPPATSCAPKADVPQHLPRPLQTAVCHDTYLLSGALLGRCAETGSRPGCCLVTGETSSSFVRSPTAPRLVVARSGSEPTRVPGPHGGGLLGGRGINRGGVPTG